MNQVLVIGLGGFGMSVARELADRGVEVLAVDRDEGRVAMAAQFAEEAVAIDVTQEDDLAALAPDRRTTCVCAIGGNRDAVIMCTALLRKLGAQSIIARANDELLERVLLLVGAHQVVNPERAFGARLATRLAYDNVVEQFRLGDGLELFEIETPASFVGKSLAELQLPRRHEVTLVVIRREGKVLLPDPNRPLDEGDVLVVVGAGQSVPRMLEKVT